VDTSAAALPDVTALLDRYPQLQRLTPAHVADVSGAFAALAPDYFLSALGTAYLARTFWTVFCESSECFGFVWIDERRAAGFAAGSIERDRFMRRVVAKAPLAFVLRSIRAACTRPQFVRQALGLLRTLASERSRGGPDSELISLGVLPRSLRPVSGPGGASLSPAHVLIAAAAAHLRERGRSEFRLYTGASNRLACAFYRRLGFRETRRFRLFGEEKVCFVAATDDPRLSA
jgi:GNAT superfamily N-acetyltransferase